MKKIATVLIFTMVFFITFSCGKDVEESVVDCLGSSVSVSAIEHSADATNPKKINYSISYDGEGSVNSIKWTFGDGKSETVKGLTVSHTYETANGYNVEAVVEVKINKSTCSVTKRKGVTVN